MQEGLVGCAGDERSDHIRIDDVGKHIALLGKRRMYSRRVSPVFLCAGFEILRISRTHVCAQEVPYEDAFEVRQRADAVRGKVLKPGSGALRKVKRQVLDYEEIVVRSTYSIGETEVF
jgi:hypothetical protein